MIIDLILLGFFSIAGVLFMYQGVRGRRAILARLYPSSAGTADTLRLEGDLHAERPLQAFDGTPVVALRRAIRYNLKSETTHYLAETTAFAPCLLTTSTGTFNIEIEAPRLVGPHQMHSIEPAALQAFHPLIWEAIPRGHRDELERVFVTELLVPNDVAGFVVGDAVEPAQVRGAARSLGFGSSSSTLLSGWDSRKAKRQLLAPAQGLLQLACISWLLAIVVGVLMLGK